jgi:micrococcal nuclease
VIEALFCLVVGVSDGDTLRARCGEAGGYQQVTVRLAEIDAPEKGQPFGQRSKLSLSALCFGAIATIQPEKRDRYGRTVARVECRGQDASAEQLRRGMAWRYVAHARDPALRPIEQEARAARAGLWGDADPTPPWEWRRARRPQP